MWPEVFKLQSGVGNTRASSPQSDTTISPVPVFPRLSGVVVFGGTFDPPHKAHLSLPVSVCEHFFGPQGMVLFVPAAMSPFKSGQTTQTSAYHRLRMLEIGLLAVHGPHARVGIWDDEIQRAHIAVASDENPSPSYTIDTLRRLRVQIGSETPVRLLIGADQAVSFHLWREYESILTIAEPAVMLREPHTTCDALIEAMAATSAWSTFQLDRWRSRVVPVPIAAGRSTDVREEIAHHRARTNGMLEPQHSAFDVRDLSPEVLAYITRHRIYAQSNHH